MVQHVVDPLRTVDRTGRIGAAHPEGQRRRIAHVGALLHDEEILVEHHLPRAPQPLRHLERLAPIAQRGGDDRQVVRRARHGHREVHDLGLHGEADRFEEDALRGPGDPGILLGRYAHERGGPDRVAPVRDGRHMEPRVAVFERVESRMVAERPLHGALLGRIDIALDHEIAVGRHPQLIGQALHQPHAAAAQKTRQEVLVHVVGHGRRGGIGIDRIAAQRHRHGHAAPQTPAGVEVPGTGLVHVPVHARGAVVEELHAVHARIAHARLGIDRVHDGQRHEPPPVAGPAAQLRFGIKAGRMWHTGK